MFYDSTRIVLYSHDAVGLGHTRRNLALAHHLVERLPDRTQHPVTGLLVTGRTHPTDRTPPGFDWLVLPGFTKTPSGYGPRHLRIGAHELAGLRSRLICEVARGLKPDLLIIDRHPLGLHRELLAPLRLLRALTPSTKVVLGLREVLDTPQVVAKEWRSLGTPGSLRALIDEVWVYGDPSVHDPLASGEVPQELHDRATFTGYLAQGRELLDPDPGPLTHPYVLTTAGGGSDGMALLQAACAMEPPAGHRHVIVTGPHLCEAGLASLRSMAHPEAVIHRHLPGLSHLIARASAVICMGGYNTACEIMASTTPALLVPRVKPRREQLIRARALERVGAVDVLHLHDLSAERLAQWASGAVRRTVSREHLQRDGLRQVPRRAAELLTSPATRHPRRHGAECVS